jgi:hypothetical protein
MMVWYVLVGVEELRMGKDRLCGLKVTVHCGSFAVQ